MDFTSPKAALAYFGTGIGFTILFILMGITPGALTFFLFTYFTPGIVLFAKSKQPPSSPPHQRADR